jgi:hypothetical protein
MELALLAISIVVVDILGKVLILLLQGYMGSTSLKISRPCGFPCEENSMGPTKIKERVGN